jgi:hypothetical protein
MALLSWSRYVGEKSLGFVTENPSRAQATEGFAGSASGVSKRTLRSEAPSPVSA